MKDEFGDFEEVVDPAPKKHDGKETVEAPIRIKLPRQGEHIGKIIQRLGGNRMEVKSSDGKVRNCRVPGRYKRKFWLRAGDLVLIQPWPDDDYKADIVFQYPPNAAYQLKKKGLIKNLDDSF